MKHDVIGFAASELRRYLTMSGSPSSDIITGDESREGALRLCLFEHLGNLEGVPDVPDPLLDDAIHIRTDGTNGIIAGSNPRSILIAAYRYLHELGCRWIRPGANGEHIPRIDLQSSHVTVTESASYRHRGICIEGAVSVENVLDIIHWSVKLGLNTYFMQFREAYTFFERWYEHKHNPLLPPEEFNVERARGFRSRIVDALAVRGMVFHEVGHGWTCEPFGIPGRGWGTVEEPPEEISRFFAEVKGERKLWGGIPMNTNLCYSNPEVRRRIIEDVVAYSKSHPEVDVLHFWLADGSNNHCECAQCAARTPSDWYVVMLNEIDAALTSARLSVRLVFLIYVDLLWPPRSETITHPERFLLMFAPITRTYSHSFAPQSDLPEIPPFQLNALEFPKSVEGNLAFLKGWQQQFSGDSFDFDYHLMWDSARDPGGISHARVIHEDMANLSAIGLNGLVSCQVQRAFCPTGLPMAAMGWGLWDNFRPLDDIANDYFASSFGAEHTQARSYIERLTELFHPPYLRSEEPIISPERAAAFAAIPDLIESFRPTMQANCQAADRCHRTSWEILARHADIAAELARALAARASGDFDGSDASWEHAKQTMREAESELQPVMDVFWTITTLDPFFAKRPPAQGE